MFSGLGRFVRVPIHLAEVNSSGLFLGESIVLRHLHENSVLHISETLFQSTINTSIALLLKVAFKRIGFARPHFKIHRK